MIGSTVGKYKIEADVAESGQARIYLAADRTYPTLKVALRAIRLHPITAQYPKAKRDKDLRRLHEQVSRVATLCQEPLHSDYIARVIGSETVEIHNDLIFFMVMDYYSLGDLHAYANAINPTSQRTRREEWAIAECLRLLQGACLALELVHKIDIFHLDVKPTNFLVGFGCGQAVLKLTDFGIMYDPLGVTHTSVRGSKGYYSPEVEDKTKWCAATDLFSLGATAYWLLTGKLIFEGDFYATRLAARASMVPVSERRPEVKEWPGLEELIAQMLEYDPWRRPQTAREVHDRIESILKSKHQQDEARRLQTEVEREAANREKKVRAEVARWQEQQQQMGAIREAKLEREVAQRLEAEKRWEAERRTAKEQEAKLAAEVSRRLQAEEQIEQLRQARAAMAREAEAQQRIAREQEMKLQAEAARRLEAVQETVGVRREMQEALQRAAHSQAELRRMADAHGIEKRQWSQQLKERDAKVERLAADPQSAETVPRKLIDAGAAREAAVGSRGWSSAGKALALVVVLLGSAFAWRTWAPVGESPVATKVVVKSQPTISTEPKLTDEGKKEEPKLAAQKEPERPAEKAVAEAKLNQALREKIAALRAEEQKRQREAEQEIAAAAERKRSSEEALAKRVDALRGEIAAAISRGDWAAADKGASELAAIDARESVAMQTKIRQARTAQAERLAKAELELVAGPDWGKAPGTLLERLNKVMPALSGTDLEKAKALEIRLKKRSL